MTQNDCTNEVRTCNYQEPHHHGFACDNTCEVCHGHEDPS